MMRPVFVLLIASALTISLKALADGPRQEPPASAAKEINGKIIKPELSVEAGGHVKSGGVLKIEFAYETSTPGEVYVRSQAVVGGKPAHLFGGTPFDLNDEAGKGSAFIVNSSPNDEIVDEFTLILEPKAGEQKGRAAATIKGPIRFAGTKKVAELAPKFLMAHIDPAASDRLLLMTPTSRPIRNDQQNPAAAQQETAFVPEVKLFLREVRAHRLDGKSIDAKQLPSLLEKPRLVLLVPDERLNQAILDLLKDNILILVVAPAIFERPSPEWKKLSQ